MTKKINKRLAELGIVLPEISTPAANYKPYVISDNLVFISGQISIWNGELRFIGKVGDEISLTEGIKAARLCGLNLLAQAQDAAKGDLDKIKQVVKLNGFVNSHANFKDHSKIINGASDLMVDVFGKFGFHARAAVGVSSLPFNVAVEVDGIFRLA